MKTVTLPEAVIFGTIIGLWLTGFRFLLAKETRPWHVYILLALVNCIISFLFATERMRLRRGWGDNKC